MSWSRSVLLSLPVLIYTSAGANLIRLQPIIQGQTSPNSSESIPYSISIGSVTITAQASMVQDLTLIRARITNNSNHSLKVMPELFSAADGHRLMMKLLQPSDVVTILQADLHEINTQNEIFAKEHQTNSSSLIVESLGEYVFGRMGLHGTEKALAMGVVEGVSAGISSTSPEHIAPPAVTPALVAREALTPTDLDPSYAEEGIVFFTVPRELPLTLMVNLNGHKESIKFDSIKSPAETVPPQAINKNATEIIDEVERLNPNDRISIVMMDGKTIQGLFASEDLYGHIWVISGEPPKRHPVLIPKIAKITRE
jgi:hypothetical protein